MPKATKTTTTSHRPQTSVPPMPPAPPPTAEEQRGGGMSARTTRGVYRPRPLNLDPDALALHRRMRQLAEVFAGDSDDKAAAAALEEMRRLMPAYREACRVIGF